MTDKPLHIALPWHSIGHCNLGVDALTRANIAILRSAAARAGREVRFTTLCSPAPTVCAAAPNDVRIGPMPSPKAMLQGRSEFLEVLKSADLVVDIGEGDSWADIYGRKRFAFHAATKIAALALGKPLVLAPQTIGPFTSSLNRSIANTIMRRCHAVFARDDLSKAYLDENVSGTNTDEFIDVAFRLPFEEGKHPDGTIKIGLNVSGLLYQGGYTGKNEFGLTIDYRALMHKLIEAFDAMPGVEVHLIPHVLDASGHDGDLLVIPRLLEAYPSLIVHDTFDSASAAKTCLSQMDFVVGGRMHACIGAFSAGVPVVPIAYSRKFNGLFGTLGYDHYVDGKTATTQGAFAKVMEGFENRNRLTERISAGRAIANARLDSYETALLHVMETLQS